MSLHSHYLNLNLNHVDVLQMQAQFKNDKKYFKKKHIALRCNGKLHEQKFTNLKHIEKLIMNFAVYKKSIRK